MRIILRTHRLTLAFLLGQVFLAFFLSACGSGPQTSQTEPRSGIHPSVTMPTPALSGARPSRLMIPSIGLNAPIEMVGIDAEGNLATPVQHPLDGLGWYGGGPRPGEMGSAVIDGHLDGQGGVPAVFWNLRQVHVRDQVRVVDSQGKVLTFRVTRMATYPPQEAPREEIFGNTGGQYLNLITCAGTWIAREHQTTLRLVVYTSLEA